MRASCAAASLCAACSTDTSGLARQDPGGESTASAQADGGNAGPSAAGAGANPEPSGGLRNAGPSALALLHGVVDGERLFACLRDAESGEALHGGAAEPAAGLEFGGVHYIPLDWDVSSRDVELDLFVAAAGALERKTCADVRQQVGRLPSSPNPVEAGDAGSAFDGATPLLTPEAPHAAGSLSLGRGVLVQEQHYALAATGCVTPEAVPNPEACGPAERAFGSRTALLLVQFGSEHVEGGRYFGLQFLNASRSLGSAELVLQTGAGDGRIPLASSVGFGALRPRVVATVEQPNAIELRAQTGAGLGYVQSWADTLQASGLEEPSFGQNYLLAAVGPELGTGGQSAGRLRLVLIPATH